jgi:hypothetical protein
MTVVGKILVFLNLVFSLVVGGFAVVDYAARSNYAAAFNAVKQQNDVLKSAAQSFQTEAVRLAKDRDDLAEKLGAQRVAWDPAAKDDKEGGANVAARALAVMKDQSATINDLKGQVDGLRKQLADEKGKNVNLLAMERQFKADAERRQEDTKILRDQLKAEMDKNFTKEKEMNALREDMVTAQIAARTLKDRNTQLEEQLQAAARTLAQLRSQGASGGQRGDNPPPEQVEGLVRRVDGNLVHISLGSDAGLSTGQTLHVFRLGSNSGYIGRIKLVDVRAKESVGQIMGRPLKQIQQGDRVASRIIPGG